MHTQNCIEQNLTFSFQNRLGALANGLRAKIVTTSKNIKPFFSVYV